MSEFVRLGGSTTDPVHVELEMFETMTSGRHPWAQYDPGLGKVLRYGLCPECNNAMQLINIDNPDPQRVPHGRHRLKQIAGFDHCLEDILGCSLLTARQKQDLDRDVSALTPEAADLRAFAVDNFNLIVGMFAEETGIALSIPLATKMLGIFFENGWYRWPTVTKDNLPWTFARLTCTFNLFGQRLRAGSPLRTRIEQTLSAARFESDGKLLNREGHRLYLGFGLSRHKVRQAASGSPVETIRLQVFDEGHEAEGPTPFFETIMTLRQQAFLARVPGNVTPGPYGQKLVGAARDVLDAYLLRHPEARTEEDEI